MPVYHFNVRDGHEILDEDGTELADVATARKEAVALAGRLLVDNAEDFWSGTNWHIDVTDDQGRLLFTLNFAAVIAPSEHPVVSASDALQNSEVKRAQAAVIPHAADQ